MAPEETVPPDEETQEEFKEAPPYREISQEELQRILEKHKKWVESEGKDGERANLTQLNSAQVAILEFSVRSLTAVDVANHIRMMNDPRMQEAGREMTKHRGANLPEADLRQVNLLKAMIWRSNLQKANLCEANLQQADVRQANLQKANLRNANLQQANLERANLLNAELINANLKEARLWNRGQDNFIVFKRLSILNTTVAKSFSATWPSHSLSPGDDTQVPQTKLLGDGFEMSSNLVLLS